FPNHTAIFDIAHDGRILIRTDSWQIGIMGKAAGETAERDLSVLDSSPLAGISDDGNLVAVSISGDSAGQKGSIYVRKFDGSPPVRVSDGHAFELSPDGKWISGYSSADGVNRQYHLWPTGAGEERTLNFPGLHLGIVLAWLPGEQQYMVFGM